MEAKISKEKVCVNKLVSKENKIINVSSDIIVPDAKPDVLNIINSNGTIGIYKKEIMDGKIKIDGNIDTYIMYLPDSKEDILRALNFNLDFSENIIIPSLKEGMQVKVKSSLKQIDARVLNGRKINVKAQIDLEIKAYSNEEIEVATNAENIDNIQLLKKNLEVNCLIGEGKTIVYAKDTFNVDSQDEIAEVLKAEFKFLNEDLKISYNKALVKADMEVKLLYLTEDNKVKKIVAKIPAVGFIDIQNISENSICDANYDIKNIIIKPNSVDEHSIYVEAEVEVELLAYENKNINIIQDLYSPTCNIEYTEKNITLLSNKNQFENLLNIKEKIKIPEIKENNILDIEINPLINDIKITNTKILYTGEVVLKFITMNEKLVNTKTTNLPFEISIDNLIGKSNIDLEKNIYIENFNYEVKNVGEILVDINLKINTKLNEAVTLKLIQNIECNLEVKEQDDYNSLILYIVRPGDSLWSISKKFNSTINEIARMNGLQDENKIDIGQKLYIPKFNYILK